MEDIGDEPMMQTFGHKKKTFKDYCVLLFFSLVLVTSRIP